jgi:hypothetical protein
MSDKTNPFKNRKDLDTILDYQGKYFNYSSKTGKATLREDNSMGKLDANAVISSGGESDKVDTKDNLIKTINEQKVDSSLYGSNRFNKLWTLYNKVKGVEGIENNPKYHKLIKKLSRKMPRTLKNLKSNIEKSSSMRAKIGNTLDTNVSVQSNAEIYNSAVERAQNFLKDPYFVPSTYESDEKNKNKGDIGDKPVTQKYSVGENLGSRLGTDISAQLKNKKW